MAVSDKKVFVGGRLRRLRQELALTQTRMAEELGVSPSYLNLVERNQRPLSAQLMLRLVDVYDVDVRMLAGEEEGRRVEALAELLSDPLFEGLRAERAELQDVVAVAPAFAQAFDVLYRAWRDSLASSGEMADRLEDPATDAGRPPAEQVRDWFEARGPYFAELEAASEALREVIGPATGVALWAALTGWLADTHHIRVSVAPGEVTGGARRRYDPHRRRLYLWERLGFEDRLFQLALQAGLVAAGELFERLLDQLEPGGEDARVLARLGLAHYMAAALLLPYEAIREAAEETRHDLDLLARRFAVPGDLLARRLVSLQRPGDKGVPFFLVRLDASGSVIERINPTGFSLPRLGGTCPRWQVHDPGLPVDRWAGELVETVEGRRWLTLARRFAAPEPGGSTRRAVLALGCEAQHAGQIGAFDRVRAEDGPANPIGPTCRLCERTDCPTRSVPPLVRRAGLDRLQARFAPFAPAV